MINFFDNFDTLTDAPNGVAKLRELILGLAVRGKLVPQDAEEKPAELLLKKIEKEKKILRNQRRLTQPISEIPVEEAEMTFALPSGWVWTRMTDIADHRLGKMLDKAKNKGQPYPYLRNINVQWLRFDLSDVKEMPFEDKELEEYEVRVNDLLVCEGGEPGRCAIWDGRVENMKFQKAIHRVRPLGGVNPSFLQYKLLADAKSGALDEHFTGATITHFTGQQLARYVIALPPLPEQRRIVAKVDKLMALCDELEARQRERREVRVRLHASALNRLLTAQKPKEFTVHWRRIRDHFDLLHDTPETIPQLRQAILQLAVRGRLVPQDMEEEPAEALLKRIASNQDARIRKKVHPRDEENEKPFVLPNGWAWATFSELGELARGKSKHRPRNARFLFEEGRYPLVQTGDVARAKTVIQTCTGYYNNSGLAQSRMWPKGTLCITIAANIADAGILGMDACFPDSVVGFLPSKELGDARYFVYFMRTAKERLQDFAPSTAQKNINIGILTQLLIPLPPANEIKRIVAKVDKLMAQCDDLEARISQGQALSQQLLESTVYQLLTAQNPWSVL